MVPDDFPSMDVPNTYHTPRPKEPFGSAADMTLASDEDGREQQQTMQLRLELQIQNTGQSVPRTTLYFIYFHNTHSSRSFWHLMYT